MRVRPPVSVAAFECQCGVTHQSADGLVPVGWTARAGHAWCSDCTRASIPTRSLLASGYTRRTPRAA